MELVIDAAGNKVEQPRDKEGYLVNEHGQRLIDLTPTAITLPRAEPVVVMVDKSSNAVMVDKSSSGDTKVDTKGLTMAERLARLKR